MMSKEQVEDKSQKGLFAGFTGLFKRRDRTATVKQKLSDEETKDSDKRAPQKVNRVT